MSATCLGSGARNQVDTHITYARIHTFVIGVINVDRSAFFLYVYVSVRRPGDGGGPSE